MQRPAGLLLLALAGSLGCTGSSTEPPAGGGDDAAGDADRGGDARPGPIAATELCDWLTTLFCQAEQTCCTDVAHRHASVDACVVAQAQDCEQQLAPLFVDPRTGYDPAVASERIMDLQDLIATCDPTAGAWTISRAGLLGVMRGTLGVSGNCSPTSSTDLAPGVMCVEPYVCKLSLEVITFVGECGAPSSVGGDCYTDLECTESHFCDPPDNWFGGGGSCTARRPNSAACGDVNGACLSLNCVAGTCTAATANSTYCLRD